jgi:hypothetical protein
LAEQPAGKFEFTFTPKHGSWLNLVEGFFSKLARSISAPHPRRGPPHGRRGLLQQRSGRSHMDLQARQGRMI